MSLFRVIRRVSSNSLFFSSKSFRSSTVFRSFTSSSNGNIPFKKWIQSLNVAEMNDNVLEKFSEEEKTLTKLGRDGDPKDIILEFASNCGITSKFNQMKVQTMIIDHFKNENDIGFESLEEALTYIIDNISRFNDNDIDIYNPIKLSEREEVPFVGAHNKTKDELLEAFTKWRNRSDPKTALEPLYVLFGVSGSGKSRTFDELSKDLSAENVLAIPITFNDFMAAMDYDNKIESELLIRILFSVFIKKKSMFNQFRKEYIEIIRTFNADITWSAILKVLQPYFQPNHNGIVILLDEILKTTMGQREINKALYDFLKRGFNETSNEFTRKDLGIIFTTLNMNEFWKLRRNRPMYPYSLPFLNNDDIHELSKHIVGFGGDFIESDRQLSLLLNASQGRPRVVIELLIAKKYGHDLLDTALRHSTVGDPDLLYHSLSINNNNNLLTFNGHIGKQSVAERIMNGTILQPQYMKQMSQQTEFVPIPSLLSIFKFMDWSISSESPSSPSIYKEALQKLANRTVKEGIEYEEFHAVYDALRREHCFNDTSKYEKIDIIFNDSKIECITVTLQDLYTPNSYYFPTNIADDILYIPRINHFGHIDIDFKDWKLESHNILNAIPFIWTFKANNQAFDHFYFSFNQAKELIGIFIENKYSKTYQKPSTLGYPEIQSKHSLLKESIKNHLQIKDFYHIFVSTKNVIQKQNINKDDFLHNTAILSSRKLTSKEILLQGLDDDENNTDYSAVLNYYGRCWISMMSYFTTK